MKNNLEFRKAHALKSLMKDNNSDPKKADVAGTPEELMQVLQDLLGFDPAILHDECVFRLGWEPATCEEFLRDH